MTRNEAKKHASTFLLEHIAFLCPDHDWTDARDRLALLFRLAYVDGLSAGEETARDAYEEGRKHGREEAEMGGVS